MWALTDDDDENDDGEEDDNDEDDDEESPKADEGSPAKAYPTFEAFLAFLEAGCRGSAAQSYPLLVLLLSTLPAVVSALSREEDDVVAHRALAILCTQVFPLTEPSIKRLLSSTWAGFDRLQPSDAAARKAFFTAILETYTFLLSRATAPAELYALLGDQVETVWKSCVLGAVARAQGSGKRRIFGRPLTGRGPVNDDDALEAGEAEAKALAQWLGKVEDECTLPCSLVCHENGSMRD